MGESPEPLIQVAAIIAGAGASGAVQGFVKGVVPQLAPEIAGGGVGFLLYHFGDRIHPLVKALGVGVMAGSLAPFVQKMIPAAKPASSSSPEGSSSPQMTPAEKAARAYIATK